MLYNCNFKAETNEASVLLFLLKETERLVMEEKVAVKRVSSDSLLGRFSSDVVRK